MLQGIEFDMSGKILWVCFWNSSNHKPFLVKMLQGIEFDMSGKILWVC